MEYDEYSIKDGNRKFVTEFGQGEWGEIYLRKNEKGEWKVVQALSLSLWDIDFLPEDVYEKINDDSLMFTQTKEEKFELTKEMLEDFQYVVDEKHLEEVRNKWEIS